ncbi:MAG: hypothetical protein H7257_00665, partial [Taibaiella sp.]|nr:hypothetical protein [Taibaiella sp.]
MVSKIVLRSIIALSCFLSAPIIAQENKPLDVFIRQVKETNDFVSVSNIWHENNLFDKTAMLQKVEKAQPLLINYDNVASLLKSNHKAISLQVPGIEGGTYTIDLAKYDNLTNDFKVGAVGADGIERITDYTPGLYYSGIVNGMPGSVAAFSFFKNEVYGIFSIPGVGNFVLVPNTMTGTYYNYNQNYILYNDRDLKIKDFAPKCGTDELPDLQQLTKAASKTTTTANNKLYTTCKDIKVYELADYSTYQSKGGSTTNVTNYMTALFNNQAAVYRNESVYISLNYIKINTATDPYQSLPASSFKWLSKFGYYTQDSMYNSNVAILLATKHGSMGGVAWLRQLCEHYYAPDTVGPYAFCNVDATSIVNFPTFSWDVEVTSHEMGHVLGSPHTHKCCWYPSGTGTRAIDGCYTLEGGCSNPGYPSGGGTIMSYCHLVSTGINFSNGFGTQPGDTIRYWVKNMFSTCFTQYNPATAISLANRTITANRECTDVLSNTTYYWYDNNTASKTDDTLVLMLNKNGNNIGTLNTTGFAVSLGTNALWGGGTAQSVTFPAGTTGVQARSYAMRRYWKINATTAPTTNVEVIFPFAAKDSSDLDGSVPGATLKVRNYLMYKTTGTI